MLKIILLKEFAKSNEEGGNKTNVTILSCYVTKQLGVLSHLPMDTKHENWPYELEIFFSKRCQDIPGYSNGISTPYL